MDQVRIAAALQKRRHRAKSTAEVQRADQMRLFEELHRRGDILRRGRHRLVAEKMSACPRGDNGEGVVMLGVGQQMADNLDLRAGQQRIAVGRRFEEKHPVAPLPLRLTRQFRSIAQGEVMLPVQLGANEAWRSGAA